jgi:hypothetical protein
MWKDHNGDIMGTLGECKMNFVRTHWG